METERNDNRIWKRLHHKILLWDRSKKWWKLNHNTSCKLIQYDNLRARRHINGNVLEHHLMAPLIK